MDDEFDEEGKLGHGFMSADELEEVDIGLGDGPRPTFLSAKLDRGFKQELIQLLKEHRVYFAWEYYEMPGLSRSIVEHRFQSNPVINHISRLREGLNRSCTQMLKPK
jgi:hypothetical protein